MSDQNGNSENRNRQRLDHMEDVIQSMITLVLEQSKVCTQQHELANQQYQLAGKQHELAMEELREMRELQRDQRIDVMSLCQGNENLRTTMQQYFERHS